MQMKGQMLRIVVLRRRRLIRSMKLVMKWMWMYQKLQLSGSSMPSETRNSAILEEECIQNHLLVQQLAGPCNSALKTPSMYRRYNDLWSCRVNKLKNQAWRDYKWFIYRRQNWFWCFAHRQQKSEKHKTHHTHKCPGMGNYTVHPHYGPYTYMTILYIHTLHTRDEICAGPMARSSRSDSRSMSADRYND